MQHRTVHHKGVGADVNRRARVQVAAVVKVDVAAQRDDPVGEAQACVVFDGRKAVHVQDQAVGRQADAQHCGHPAAHCDERLSST
ncbi:MAG: hypothetical protein R2854_22255 [Caldilineaceae bacterium]